MDVLIPAAPISPLRQRLIDDMTMRRFSDETQRSYTRDVGRLATFRGRSPATRKYSRLVYDWVAFAGLDPAAYGTYSLRRTKVALVYKRRGKLRTC